MEGEEEGIVSKIQGLLAGRLRESRSSAAPRPIDYCLLTRALLHCSSRASTPNIGCSGGSGDASAKRAACCQPLCRRQNLKPVRLEEEEMLCLKGIIDEDHEQTVRSGASGRCFDG